MRAGSPDGCPRVVACMPAYASVVFITPVLESLAAQTYPNLELLISVDVCSDGTAELYERFAETHANVRVIRQTERQGWVGNSNALLEAAHGAYLFFAFHDDPLEPTYVARLVDELDQNPRAVVAFTDVDTNHGPMTYPYLDDVASRFERVRRLLFVEGTWWVPLRGLVRIAAVRQLGGMRRLAYGEFSTDLPWLLRLALLGEFVRIPERLIHKELREAGLAASWKQSVRNKLAVQLACVRVIRGAGFSVGQQLLLYSEFGQMKNWLRRARAFVRGAAQPAR
jgi:glycosyltransferase involved in cell wall biosynthesis